MGRGRAKAKQTRVARDLKYRSVETDFAELERELRGEQSSHDISYQDEYDDVPDQYLEIARRYSDDEEVGYDDERR